MEVVAEGIDHLGIVSGICDEIELVKTIDSLIKQGPLTKVSIGTRVKAMILNCLGWTGRAVYLTPQFYEKKPLDLLLGENIKPEDLNDDAIGRALDAVYKANPELVFSTIAAHALDLYKVKAKKLHLDSTSKSVNGEYKSEEGVGFIRFGYSKDLRKDLKQFILHSLSAGKSGIPIMYKALAGNSADSKHFKETLKEFKENAKIDLDGLTITFDAAGYNVDTLQSLAWTTWVSRAPTTIAKVKELKSSAANRSFEKLENGYSIFETRESYGEIEQRWILVKSEAAYRRSKGSITRRVKKECSLLEANMKKLMKKKFSCAADAKKEFDLITTKPKFHSIQLLEIAEEIESVGKNVQVQVNKKFYRLNVKISEQIDKITQAIDDSALFIVATNELDSQKMPAAEVLSTYKNQSAVERGFRFLKNPICAADAVYIKTVPRIKALSAIMFISLLVYSLAEFALRKSLVESGLTVPNQIKKKVQNPTMRWIFQMMEDIIVIRYREAERLVVEIKNLTEELITVIKLLGINCMNKYLISS